MRDAARRQGRRAGRDDAAGHAGACRLHDHHRGLRRALRSTAAAGPTAWPTRSTRRSRRSSSAPGKRFGDADDAAAGLGALRRARLDARDDGHDPQPRPQRRDGRRAAPSRPATRASPTTPTAASCRCSATSSLGVRRAPLRGRARRARSTSAACQARHRPLRPTTCEALVDEFKALVPRGARGVDFPQDPHEQLWRAIDAVFARWDDAARARLPAGATTSPTSSGTAVNIMPDGLRQHGRRLRHRRRLHARPVDRRAACSTASSCATRRARTSSPASARPSRIERAWREVMPEAYAQLVATVRRASRSTTATCRTSSSPSSGARSTCCRRAPASAPPRPRCASPSRWSTRA